MQDNTRITGKNGPVLAAPPTGGRSTVAERGHLGYIDGLRGLAILMVLLYHVWQDAHCPAAYWWNPLTSAYTGVSLFLVLSGFCLYWPLVRPNRPSPEPSLAAFWRRRARRILPPYYAALGLFTVLALVWQARGERWPEGPGGGPAVVLSAAAWHLLLLQNLCPEHLWTIDGPLWSLALEVSFYVAMPLLVVAARRTQIEWAVALAALITLSYRAALDRWIGGEAGWKAAGGDVSFVLANCLPGRWLEFALGMWAAALVARRNTVGSRVPFSLLALALLALGAWLRSRWGEHNPCSDSLFGLGFFCLILRAARRPTGSGAVVRARPLVWLGTISYSVYLLHQPLLKALLSLTATRTTHDRDIIVLCLFALLPALVGISYLFHLLVERRFLNAPTGTAPPAAHWTPARQGVA